MDRSQEKMVAAAFAIMKQALEDIHNGINLGKWSEEIDNAIDELNRQINNSDEIAGYERLKNELFYLKYLIAEKQ